ncbi:MAG: DUF1573 domain-containing protein [Deltaproteobacteria bacterium]|nr:DUF1573 domain-containing protein [Deltaproteobacteria bacterium]
MKRTGLLIALVAYSFLSLIFLSGSRAQKPPGPQIYFQEKNFDFQEVEEGSVLDHTFRVSNRGDQPLVIEKVSPA